jgi:hypothetical protein
VLRDPIERAYSNYRMIREHFPERETRSFNEAVLDELALAAEGYGQETMRQCEEQESLGPIYHDPRFALWFMDQRYLHNGLYARCLRRYERAFGPSRMLVIDFQELTSCSQRTMERVWGFLGLPPLGVGALDTTPQNVGAEGLKEGGGMGLDPQTLESLRAFFAESNREVAERYGIRF